MPLKWNKHQLAKFSFNPFTQWEPTKITENPNKVNTDPSLNFHTYLFAFRTKIISYIFFRIGYSIPMFVGCTENTLT